MFELGSNGKRLECTKLKGVITGIHLKGEMSDLQRTEEKREGYMGQVRFSLEVWGKTWCWSRLDEKQSYFRVEWVGQNHQNFIGSPLSQPHIQLVILRKAMRKVQALLWPEKKTFLKEVNLYKLFQKAPRRFR